MLKRSIYIANEISRLHIEKIGTDCNIAVNTQAIARLVALELVKAVDEAVAAEMEACAKALDAFAAYEAAAAIRSRADVK